MKVTCICAFVQENLMTFDCLVILVCVLKKELTMAVALANLKLTVYTRLASNPKQSSCLYLSNGRINHEPAGLAGNL